MWMRQAPAMPSVLQAYLTLIPKSLFPVLARGWERPSGFGAALAIATAFGRKLSHSHQPEEIPRARCAERCHRGTHYGLNRSSTVGPSTRHARHAFAGAQPRHRSEPLDPLKDRAEPGSAP